LSTERIDIYGGKATIKQNKYGVWQFRMWVSNEKRYYEKSLRTKRRAEAIDKAEKLKKVYEDFGDVRYEGDRYVAFAKWWNAKLANGETKGAYLFAEPLTEMKVELVEDMDTAERLIADVDELLIRVSKGMKRTHIDKTLNRLFKKHIEFEKGRQTRNPNRSNARYSLSKPIAIDSLQTAFALYDLIEQATANGTKVNNYALAEQVGIKVGQRNTEEEWDDAYKRRVVSVAVSRKKKVALEAIEAVANGVFPI
jgi:hypothetical protein